MLSTHLLRLLCSSWTAVLLAVTITPSKVYTAALNGRCNLSLMVRVDGLIFTDDETISRNSITQLVCIGD